MDFSRNGSDINALPSSLERPSSELSLVEIAEQLEKVTGWIEHQRVRERDARTEYDKVRVETEEAIKKIRAYAQDLVKNQNKKVSAFDGLLGVTRELKPATQTGKGGRMLTTSTSPAKSPPKNLADAIVALWAPDQYKEPLTTEEIASSLHEVGYKTDAAASSIKSSVNQALAKLCKVGTIVRLRADDSVIPPKDKTSRARKYLAAARLPEDVVIG